MRILFVTNRHFLPQAVGGAEWSTHLIAEGLKRLGHDVAVMCSIYPKDALGIRNRIARRVGRVKFPYDTGLGYPVYRGWDPIKSFASVTADWRPDRIVVIGAPPRAYELAVVSVELGYRTFYQVRDIAFDSHGGDISSVQELTFIANSEFTRARIKEVLGRDSQVILPPIAPERCKVERPGKRVLMINPDPRKGGDAALSLAELCPDIPFLIQESWSSNKTLVDMKRKARAFKNVLWKSPQMDMRNVYSQAKILLVPSRLEEAWGRVVSEAQVSGIPSIASRLGGLPESVGPGGVLVDVDADISTWEKTLRSLWDSTDIFNQYSKAAIAHAQRPEMRPSSQAKLLFQILDDA